MHRHENRRAECPRSDGCGVTVPAPPAGDRPSRDADRSESLRCENATVARARAPRGGQLVRRGIRQRGEPNGGRWEAGRDPRASGPRRRTPGTGRHLLRQAAEPNPGAESRRRSRRATAHRRAPATIGVSELGRTDAVNRLIGR